MSNLRSGINARLRGVSSKNTESNEEPPHTSLTTPDSTIRAPQVSLPESTLFSQEIDTLLSSQFNSHHPRPLWLNPAYAKHIVKGNFMTLSTRPKTVEQGEWVAHQVVEHYRNLWNFVRIVHEKEDDGSSICNHSTCPRMSAGRNHSYTWLNRNNEPIELGAYDYMSLMQRWLTGKFNDEQLFPTDPAGVSAAAYPDHTSDNFPPKSEEWLGIRSGFPKHFASTCQLIFHQIFRIYAHLYWDHFVEPFYHLKLEKQLNSCFSHFILTAITLNMLQPKELEPMQLLIDLWAADGTFPPQSAAYNLANVERGKQLLN